MTVRRLMPHSVTVGRIPPSTCATTFAGGLLYPESNPDALTLTLRFPLARTPLLLLSAHNLPEPAGAIALTGLLRERHQQRGGGGARVLTGGNVDTAAWPWCSQAADPPRIGRRHM